MLAAISLVLLGVMATGCGDDDESATPDGAALCLVGEMNCDGTCADLMESPQHCGECGNECEAPDGGLAVCNSGECEVECPAEVDEDDAGVTIEKTLCDEMCVDLESDEANCGECGAECREPAGGDVACNDGECEITCDVGLDQCGGDCFNFLISNDHCGECGTACTGDQVCANGNCVLSCPEGEARCDDTCVDISDDVEHCGGCGNSCPEPVGDGERACDNGQCTASCASDETACDGTCVNTETNAAHCGDCGNVCSGANGTPTCTGGACTIACSGGFDDCDDDVANGCEADLSAETNCSDCTTTCSGGTPFCDDNGGAPMCSNTCSETTCTSPERCVDTSSDPNDCGACGTVCDEPASGAATGNPICNSSNCDVTCSNPTGTKVTRGSATGCVNTNNDAQACGVARAQCAAGERCVNGACAADACAVGLTSTSGGCANLQSSGANCGAPDMTCTGTIIGAGCVAGQCFCNEGDCATTCGSLTRCTRDCVDTQTDPAHCGACGNTCDSGERCEAGVCRSFIYASGCWECGAGNAFDACCANALDGHTICVADEAHCP